MAKDASLSSLDYHFSPKQALVGSQMFFVAFGALVLVPLLTGLNPNVAMFTAGVGTLAFQVITRGRIPIFLASSFAFIAPIQEAVKIWGIPAILGGLAATGVMYMLISLLVRLRGVAVIQRILPPVVTGPVIMVIGLSLAPVAVNMATGAGVGIPRNQALIVAGISLAATIIASVWGRGVIRLIPIFCGIVAGYVASLFYGMIDFAPVKAAPWFAVPSFVMPEWDTKAVLFILPVAIAPIIEHVGNVAAISSVTGRDYIKDPGLHRTLLGDGVATTIASCLGGPPNTTYAEVTGGVALTRAFNPAVMTWAALTAIALAFVGKLGALLGTIPVPVMGGIMVLLFGSIAVVGINSLTSSKTDFMEPRNMVIIAVILVCGLGGLELFGFSGIGLAGIVGLGMHVALSGISWLADSILGRQE